MSVSQRGSFASMHALTQRPRQQRVVARAPAQHEAEYGAKLVLLLAAVEQADAHAAAAAAAEAGGRQKLNVELGIAGVGSHPAQHSTPQRGGWVGLAGLLCQLLHCACEALGAV